MTPRLLESRRWRVRQAIQSIMTEGKLGDMPGIYRSAAIDIARYGWWKLEWGGPMEESGPKCIWLAVEAALLKYGRENFRLIADVRCYIEWELLGHFGLTSVSGLISLNDRQLDHEGQGWAIYHLNTLARRLRARHKIE